MRRMLLSLLLLLLALVPCAQAEDDPLALCQARYPDTALIWNQQWGATAAAALRDDTTHLLICEQGQDGWEIVCDAGALLPDAEASFLLDSDNVLFWSLDDENSNHYLFCAQRLDDVWQLTSVDRSDPWAQEVSYGFQNGVVRIVHHTRDTEDNLLALIGQLTLPQTWLANAPALDAIDPAALWSVLTLGLERSNEQPALRDAAAVVRPKFTYLDGAYAADGVRLLMRKPDGQTVFVGIACDASFNQTITMSTPLPEGTQLGLENFTTSLYCPGRFLVDVAPDRMLNAPACWHVSNIWTLDAVSSLVLDELSIREWSLPQANELRVWGAHPWADVTIIDWTTLPTSMDEAIAATNLSGWAVVHNDRRENRLHLRTRPDKSATSLGKFYDGTPVQILSVKGDWAEVSVCGRLYGWMMRAYLAEGDAMLTVEPVYHDRLAVTPILCFDTPNGALLGTLPYAVEGYLCIGVYGDDWECLWNPIDNLLYWIKSADAVTGNG